MDFRETFKMSNETYDKLKYIVMIILPALTVLVGAVGVNLSIPNTDIAVTLMAAVTTFLGSVLGVSSYNYNNEVK